MTKFSLAKYVNYGKPMKDKLRIKNCEYDKNAFVEIYVNAKAKERGDGRNSRATTILSVDEIDLGQHEK